MWEQESQMEHLKEVSPNVYKLFDALGIREVAYGFGWIIVGQSGTRTLYEIFDYIGEQIEEFKVNKNSFEQKQDTNG